MIQMLCNVMLFMALLISGCYIDLEATVTQHPSLAKRRAHRVSHYSTHDGKIEKVGTITESFTEIVPVVRDSLTCFERLFKGDNSRYYHKHSIPFELSFRVPVSYCVEKGRIVSIDGHDSFADKVVKDLPVPEKFKAELLDSKLPAQFDTFVSDYYYLAHMFEGTFPVLKNVTDSLKDAISQSPVRIDSVVTGDLEKILGLKTLPFSVYYRVEPLYNHLMLEQLVAAAKTSEGFTTEGEVFKNTRFMDATGTGRYTVWVEVESGDVVKEIDLQNHMNRVRSITNSDTLTFESIQYTETTYENVK